MALLLTEFKEIIQSFKYYVGVSGTPVLLCSALDSDFFLVSDYKAHSLGGDLMKQEVQQKILADSWMQRKSSQGTEDLLSIGVFGASISSVRTEFPRGIVREPCPGVPWSVCARRSL